MKFTRRAVAKGLAAGTAAGLSGLLRAESSMQEHASPSAEETLLAPMWRRVFPGVWRATLGTPERVTPVSTRLVPPQIEAFANLPYVDAAPLHAIRGRRTERGCMVQLPLRPNEHIYGLGLQFLSFDQRGKKKVTRVNADPKADTGDSHAPVPFYVTTEGVGILVDTARYASFYFGDARPKPTHAVERVSTANPDPNYTHNLEDGDTGQITVEVPHAAGVDVYLFAGPEMIDAVRRYNVFAGGGPVLPDWGLGFWYRMDARAIQQSATTLAQEFRERNIPCDVLGLEPGWQTHAYSCTFVWDKERFPDPQGFVHSVEAMNYKVNLWEHAYTHPASPLFSTIEAYSGNFGVWGGLVPDFAGDPARKAFGDYHGNTFVDAGVSGFKLDECDNSDFTGGWSFPECSAFPSGVDGEQMHSLFGLRYQMAIWDAFRKRGKTTYNLVRSSGALATPYPFVLYSDLYNHRDYIRALVNSGFSGLLWCPEVRDAVSEEDLIRRLQSVVFSPLAMVNGWYIKNPPWKQLNRPVNNADQLLDGWEKLEARCREIISWRMHLAPYLKASFQQYCGKWNSTIPCPGARCAEGGTALPRRRSVHGWRPHDGSAAVCWRAGTHGGAARGPMARLLDWPGSGRRIGAQRSRRNGRHPRVRQDRKHRSLGRSRIARRCSGGAAPHRSRLRRWLAAVHAPRWKRRAAAELGERQGQHRGCFDLPCGCVEADGMSCDSEHNDHAYRERQDESEDNLARTDISCAWVCQTVCRKGSDPAG